MTQYAKYIDENTIQLPPTNYNGISNYCNCEEKLIEDGYLPFVVEEEPTAEKYLKKYRLEDGTIYQYTVADTSDCNNYTEAGDYYLGVGLHDNCPFGEACQFALNVSIYNGIIVQEAIGLDTEQKRFKRTCVDGVWGEWLELGSGSLSGGSEKIGSIISMLASATYTPDGCLPCDGIEYNKPAYNSFYTSYLVSGKLATCTYEEYEADITAYGQCAKFALDTINEKFKTPTIKDGSYLTQALSDTEIGKAYNESLPNIKGDFYLTGASGSYGTMNGAFYLKEKGIGYQHGGSGSNANPIVGFDASLSSSSYQDGVKVQGDNIRVRFFVVVAVMPDDVSDDILNSKADKSQFQVVDTLPETPNEDTFYFIPE